MKYNLLGGAILKKKKNVKPDDYFSNGIFEVARFGKNVVLHNNMTPEMHEKYLEFLASKYEEKVELIDNIIEKIRKNVSLCDAKNLMNFIITMRQMVMINKVSEAEYSIDDNASLNIIEYIQSIIISDGINLIDTEEDQSALYNEILVDTENLYKEIKLFLMFWEAKMRIENPDENMEDLKYVFEAQLFSYVRGDRYQVFQIPYYEELLGPFNEYFNEIYGVCSKEIIGGLKRLERSLSSGRLDSMNAIGDLMDQFANCITDEERDSFMEIHRQESEQLFGEFLGTNLFDIKQVTNWPDDFIDDLSFEAGENDELFQHEEFPGWPIWNLPVERKPFVKIDNKAYGFDYYIVFDNLYRAIQRAIRSKGRKYEDGWGNIQQDTSEALVEKLFQKLLPGCNSYVGNYYQEDYENDLLISYKDVLMIVEVKAGAFTYTPALTDLAAHKSSFEALVNKAGRQCKRTLDYLETAEIVDFFDKNGVKKVTLRRGDYSQVYSFCVTVDDFNVFAAHAEKLDYVKIQSGTISISINDLWVYSEYFKSPLKFIHFIEQREIATKIQELSLKDELDHLGLYIEHNMYSIHAKQMGQGNFVNYNGYREDLDKYFASLHNPVVNSVKPEQKLPHLIERMCELAENSDISSLFTNFILDFSSESKENFVKSILMMLEREKVVGGEIAGINVQNGCYCVFVYQPGIDRLSKTYKSDYAKGLMLFHQVDECWLMEMEFDAKGILNNMYAELINRTDIEPERVDELYKLGEEGVNNRKKSFLVRTNQKKIYPNDACPCGSGKKFKKCCGKYGM